MKTSFFVILFFVFSFGFSQNNHIVKTDDGRRVLLKSDFTWEYIDSDKMEVTRNMANTSLKNDDRCNLGLDYEEPELNNQIQAQLKKGRATISHVKKKVAKDYKCLVSEVILLSVSEDKDRGRYDFCAKGKKVSYKRNGFIIIKSMKIF